MLIEFFEKLEKSKWLPWVGMTPFIIIPMIVMFDGAFSRGMGLFIFFVSVLAGIIIGVKFAQIVATYLPQTSQNIEKRLTASFSVFGFLFVPVLVASFTNSNLGTEIGMHALSTHFLWACVVAGIVFCISPQNNS